MAGPFAYGGIISTLPLCAASLGRGLGPPPSIDPVTASGQAVIGGGLLPQHPREREYVRLGQAAKERPHGRDLASVVFGTLNGTMGTSKMRRGPAVAQPPLRRASSTC